MAGYSFDLPPLMRKFIGDEPGAAAWIERLPGIVDTCVEHWRLQPEAPFAGSYASLVVPVTRPDGSDAVLKLNFPNPDMEQEPAALRHWGGRGAVRLYDEWPEQRALLIERCRPGDQLWSVEDEDEATRIFAAAVRRAYRPAPPQHPFRLLADEAARWAADMPAAYEAAGRVYDRRILDTAVEAMRTLGPEQGPPVVLHQDLHGGNILRSQREPWLLIDAQPLVGELEFDMASYLRDRRHRLAGADGQRIVQRRLDILADELPIDRKRARLWAIGHIVAWDGTGGLPGEFRRAAELLLNCR